MKRINFLAPYTAAPPGHVRFAQPVKLMLAAVFLAFASDFAEISIEHGRWNGALHRWAESADARTVREAVRERAENAAAVRIVPRLLRLAGARTSAARRAAQIGVIATSVGPRSAISSIELTHDGYVVRGTAAELIDVGKLVALLNRAAGLGRSTLLSANTPRVAGGAASVEFAIRISEETR